MLVSASITDAPVAAGSALNHPITRKTGASWGPRRKSASPSDCDNNSTILLDDNS